LRRGGRSGLTLIELLIVVSIIIVLASLTIGALVKATDWMRRSTTEQLLLKVDTVVQKKAQNAARESENWDTPGMILTLAGGHPKRARVIQRKFMLKWSFPQSYREAAYNCIESDASVSAFGFRPGGYPFALQVYTELRKQNPTLPVLPGLPPVPASDAEAAAQSAGCLAVIYNLLASTDQLSGNEFRDSNGDGVYEVIDAWDTPIAFFRWPTYLTLPTAANRLASYVNNASVLLQDQEDPEGLIYDNTWQTTTLVALGYTVGIPGTTTCAEEIEARFHPIRRTIAGVPQPSPLQAPLTLVSAATDRQFGIRFMAEPIASYPPGGFGVPLERAQLYTPSASSPAQQDEFDNLYSFRVRSGSRNQ
jgi:type II secretory pathway pseudopilin PulG